MYFRQWKHLGPDLFTTVNEYSETTGSNMSTSLVIHNVTYRDSGLYISTVCNGVGNIESGTKAAKKEIYVWVKGSFHFFRIHIKASIADILSFPWDSSDL